MNHSVLDWNMEEDRNQKKFIGPDNELMEILWRNGHVVMHSQTHRKPPPSTSESKQGQKPEPEHGVTFKSSIDLIHETNSAPWFQYPIDDSLEREFCSELFCQMPGGDETGDKVVAIGGEKSAASMLSNLCYEENTMPPLPPPPPPCLENGGVMNPSIFSKKTRVDSGFSNRELGQRGESSSKLAIGSSACGSNQVQDRIDESRTFSNNMTGVSGGSSFGKVGVESANNSSHKRKRREGEESESHSEEADYESFDIENRQAKRSASARRTRASEVHNLSERRRRDRINEKMKALQELIPHCTKSDKASMLDEAIEYLKSLQLQVQIMWTGGGMAPVLYPGVQRYMSAIGAGMVHSSMPLTRSPLIAHPLSLPPNTDRTMIHPSAPLNSMDFQTQMPNIHLLEPYAGYLGFNQLPQAMNFFPYGSRAEQQNRAFGDNCGIGGISSDKTQNGQSG